MPQPTIQQVHVNQPLTNVSVAYVQAASNFVASKVFPIVPVPKKSDVYFSWDKQDWMRDDAALRQGGAPATRTGMNLTNSNSYLCSRYDLAHAIPDDIRDNADVPLNMDIAATQMLTQSLLIRRENLWASKAFTTGIWGTIKTGTTDFVKWDVEASSDPIVDISAGRMTVLGNTGFLPNKLVVGAKVHEALKKHPMVLERYKYTSSESINEGMLARLFEVEEYLVARAIYTADHENTTSPTYSFCAGNSALLCYSEKAPALMKPSAGYIFTWSKFAGTDLGIRVKKWRDENVEASIIECAFAMDFKVIGTDLGYFFYNAVS
jgi:hypothetical protein